MITATAIRGETANLEMAFPGCAPSAKPWYYELPHGLFVAHELRRGLVTVVQTGSEANRRRGRHEGRNDTGQLRVGSVVDKYRVEEVLGQGAFATVYRATHLILQKQVALKVLHRHLLKKDPRFVDMLCEESRHTAQLDHPNIVRVFDVTRSAEATYIVLEWVDGESLSKRVRQRGVITAAAAVRIATDICGGLDAALARGLVHRDIKPSNILLLKDGAAKIIDLGLARHDLSKQSALGRDAVVGTPGYMAPEQVASARSVDLRADIYSLGATLYFALSGRLPFRVKTVEEVKRLKPQDSLRPLQMLAPKTPEELAELIESMLAFSPQNRPQSYGEILRALRTLG